MRGALTLKSKKRLNEIVTIVREKVPGDWQRHSHVTRFLEHCISIFNVRAAFVQLTSNDSSEQ